MILYILSLSSSSSFFPHFLHIARLSGIPDSNSTAFTSLTALIMADAELEEVSRETSYDKIRSLLNGSTTIIL